MPIKIKRPELKTREKRFCISSLVCAGVSVGFTASLFLCMEKIVTKANKPLTTIEFTLFMVYFASCLVCLFLGAMAYKYEDSMGALGKCAVYVINSVFCLMNMRFALSLIAAAYGADSTAEKIIGSQGTAEFIKAQYIPWICLVGGTMLNVMAGVFSALKLMKNKQ
ncbi:hypothetical protein [Ruminococcus sp.]|uniref:hypothetical protein n=1 Tax=Ruminococcus sp. TaxID=41978 RepID=UPI0025D97B8C|nr:hypothetical protein [Ruminococcus sp.]MBQ8965311.1 hypothetical protein [Ruminococcus sp.]